jgi:ERF superfamily
VELRHSESIGKVVEALAKASSEFKPITKNTTNPYYQQKYADLSALIDATRPALAANGLVVLQTPRVISNRAVEITSMLAHSSGEFMAFDISFPAWQDTKDGTRFDAQTIGSAITYGRRYSYQSLLNISAEEDDDGNATVKRNGHAEAKTNGNGNGHDAAKPNGKATPEAAPAAEEPKITQTEQNAFWSACKKSDKKHPEVRTYLGTLGIANSDEILKKDFPSALRWAMEAA